MNCTPKVRRKTFGVLFMKYSYEYRNGKTALQRWVSMVRRYESLDLKKERGFPEE